MKLRILKLKSPPEVIGDEFVTEKLEFPIEWAGRDCMSNFRAYSDKGCYFEVWPDGQMVLNGKKLELVKAYEIVP